MRKLWLETSFAGVPFQQDWCDLPLWEYFFNQHPCRSVIELGTGQGGMAAFFAVQALARGMSFATFDRSNLMKPADRVTLEQLGVTLYSLDIFDQPDVVRRVIAEQLRPLVLFCDDGDKPREFQTFVPALKSGDYVAVHDWNTEIRAEDIQPPLPMILVEECEAITGMTRFFRVD